MRLPQFLNGSVAIRTTILVLTAVTIIMVIGGLWQIQFVSKIVSKDTHELANRSMESAIKVIDNRIACVETAVNTAASYAHMFAPHESLTYTLLERLIAANEDIAAVTLLYRADYFPIEGRYFAPTVTRNPETGALEEDEIGGPEHDFCYLETDSSWIYTCKLDKGYWCLPYIDSMSTKRPLVTYSVPLHDEDGSTYAVLCADIDLQWVKTIVDEAKPYSYSRVFVLSRDSQYVYHPDSRWILSKNAMQHAQQLNDTSILHITRRMLQGEKSMDTVLMADPFAQQDSKEKLKSYLVYYAPIERVSWSLCFSMPEEDVLAEAIHLRIVMVLFIGILLVVVATVLRYVIHSQLQPLRLLSQKTHEVAKGEFDAPLPVITTNDEIRYLRDSFEEMQQSLSQYISELKQTTALQASIESELHVANDIQMSMLPKQFPPFPDRNDIDVYGMLTPAKAVGGDLFDFYIRDEKLFFCIGDVSGKGVPASLVMAVTHTQFRTLSTHEALPERIINTLNEAMVNSNDSNMFVTLFIGVLDLPTGRLRYCNAGHDAPILIGKEVGTLPCASNIPVGIMGGWKYIGQEAVIDPQTIIFLFTDGLAEAEDMTHAQFGNERIINAIKKQTEDKERTPRTIIEKMTKEVHDFVGEAEQSDDLTMLAVQYTKQQLDVRYQRSITLPNDIQTIPQLATFVDEVCEAIGFDMATTMQMNLAIEEAVVNVMNYAYPAGTKGTVNIKAQVNDERLKFIISDTGAPFDPTTKAEVDTTLSAEERSIGGLGIHLVRQLMDSINYERTNGMNILTLRKKLPDKCREAL